MNEVSSFLTAFEEFAKNLRLLVRKLRFFSKLIVVARMALGNFGGCLSANFEFRVEVTHEFISWKGKIF